MNTRRFFGFLFAGVLASGLAFGGGARAEEPKPAEGSVAAKPAEGSVAATPAQASTDKPAEEPPAVKARKDAQRRALEKVQIYPRPKGESLAAPTVDEWTDDGHVKVLSISANQKGMSGKEPGKTSLAPLSALAKLEELEIMYTAIEELRPLARLKKLRKLRLLMCMKVKNLAPLGRVKSLVKLQIEYIPARGYAALAGLRNLEELSLPGVGVQNTSFLRKLTKLKSLDLAYNDDITDIAFVAKLPHLEHLSLVDTAVNDLSPLKALKKLKRLILNDEQDAKALEGKEGLEIIRQGKRRPKPAK